MSESSKPGEALFPHAPIDTPPLIHEVSLRSGLPLEGYAQNAPLAPSVASLQAEAAVIAPRLRGRTLWMVNSTAKGGGVAEMLPKQVSLLRHLGVDTRWVVIGSQHPEFFHLTKRLHNLIHGTGDPALGATERQLYDSVSEALARAFAPHLSPNDILVIHDPQPAGMGALLGKRLNVTTVWRCHIGVERENTATRAAWEFLKPYLTTYDHTVFTASAYIADYLSKDVSIIRPAIDPVTHKNRELHPVKLTGILCNSGLSHSVHPVLTPPFPELATRLTADGEFRPANGAGHIGLLYRPTVTQVSRWDRLKGWTPLLEGFVRMKHNHGQGRYRVSPRGSRRLDIVRLILAGPEVGSVQDDPEAQGVLDDIIAKYRSLEPRLQEDIAIISLPMESSKRNGLIVNALQRASSLIVQNSVQEGFGLVVTEAMWKRTPVLGSSAYGIREQVRDGIDGALIREPENPESVEQGLQRALNDAHQRISWARSAQRRVYDEFLIFKQLSRWLQLLSELVAGHPVSKRFQSG